MLLKEAVGARAIAAAQELLVFRPRPVVSEARDGVCKLQGENKAIVKTLVEITGLIEGWKAEQGSLANRVANTNADVAQLKEDMAQLRHEMRTGSKRHRERCRSRSREGICCCKTQRYNIRNHGPLTRGDPVWIRPSRGGDPKVKRFFVALDKHGFNQLATDENLQDKHKRAVRNYEMFVAKDLCTRCRRSR